MSVWKEKILLFYQQKVVAYTTCHMPQQLLETARAGKMDIEMYLKLYLIV